MLCYVIYNVGELQQFPDSIELSVWTASAVVRG